MKLHKKFLSLLLSLSFLTASLPPLQSFADDVTAGRISGMDRYSTSAAVSRKTFSHSDYAIIASGDKFPDALSASQIATVVDCPILLTNSKYLSSAVKNELYRLNVKKILIIGGAGSVSSSVFRSLASIADTSRLSGVDRYETSYLAAQLTLRNKPDINTCVVASGLNFADALSASTYVSAYGCIMILNDGRTPVPKSGMNIILVGGHTPNPSNDSADKRIYGSDRYQTSLKVAKDAYPNPENVVFANGENYPDALASISVLNKANNAPLLLTNGRFVSSGVRSYLGSSSNFNHIYVVGGENSIKSTSINVFISNTFNGSNSSSDNENETSNETTSSETASNETTSSETTSSETASNETASNETASETQSNNDSSSSSQRNETSYNDDSSDNSDYDNSSSSGYSVTDPSLFKVFESKIYDFKKANINTLVIPSVINGETIKSIDYATFKSKGIHTLILPDTIENIGSSAFENNNISSIILPRNLKTIGINAFSGNDIKNLYVPDSVSKIDKRAFYSNGMNTLEFAPDNKIGDIGSEAFLKNNITSVVLPKTASLNAYWGESVFDKDVSVTFRK